jgi:hypothetical protein
MSRIQNIIESLKGLSVEELLDVITAAEAEAKNVLNMPIKAAEKDDGNDSQPRESKNYTICTEENPQIGEVQFILNYLHVPAKVVSIAAKVTKTSWNGSFEVVTDQPTISIELRLVKGHGSFVDYIVYEEKNPDEEKSVPILLMESTKTDDSESRNTSINQRFTKFAVARQRFPTTPLVLYFNKENNATTPTSVFGRRLLATFGVEAYDTEKNILLETPAFTTVTELIQAKNAIREKAGNVSVKITELTPHHYQIRAKLNKGAETTICHDPNKGLVTGIASAIYALDKEASFVVAEHGVDTSKMCKRSDKFWYANNRYDLRLEGSDLSTMGVNAVTVYWTFETQSEKSSTILFQNCMEMAGKSVLYHNHSSSARSYFVDSKQKNYAVPKDVTIPDLVLADHTNQKMYICEGKIKKDILMGVRQLDNLTKFIEYVQPLYPSYTIEKGLCVYVPKLDDLTAIQPTISYPIWFGLDSQGNYTINL